MLSQEQFFALSSLLKDETAVVLEAGKEYLVESRLNCLMREEGFATLSDLVDTVLLRGNAGLNQKVLMALTTNETSFFRDLAAFDLLRNSLIPELLKARATTRSITIWSMACSTGQEPYSIAIALRETIPDLASWNVKIMASDLNPTVVARAARGVFSSLEVNRGLPVQLLLKYFTQHGDSYHISDDVKAMVSFFEQNLIGDWLPGLVDVFFMRNVLIYFDADTKRRIFEKAKGALAADGYLFLGAAETPYRIVDGLCKVPGATSVYRREGRDSGKKK